MMNKKLKNVLLLICLVGVFSSCQNGSESASNVQELKAEGLEKSLQEILITAEEGTTIVLPEGEFSFNRPLSLNDTPDITIKGAGMKKTVLSFKEQVEGGEGMIIKNVNGITLEGFSVRDSKGDAIKVQECQNVTFRDIETTWTGGALETNGGYGLYPVQCTNVLMEKCEASYSMDAGVYVGQSNNITVRDNYVHHNVAGLEIENSINAEVYKNTAKNNTAGLLIFDMPDLPQANGSNIKVYDNVMEDNNFKNFSPEGIVVHMLPPGTGMLLMAHKDMEIYNNKITNHKTIGIGINSWLFTGREFKSPEYDPFCMNVNVHDNIITEMNGPVDTTSDFGKLFTALFQGEPKAIVTDGIMNPALVDESGSIPADKRICIRNNGEVSFVNLNAGMGATPAEMMKNMNTDMSIFDCELQTVDTGEYDKWLTIK